MFFMRHKLRKKICFPVFSNPLNNFDEKLLVSAGVDLARRAGGGISL